MYKYERKFIEWAEKNATVLLMIIISLLSLLARYKLRNFESTDAIYFIEPWFETIKYRGGLKALGEQVGDYGIPYQTLIAFCTYLPFKGLNSCKLISVFFDFVLAIGCYKITKLLTNRRYVSCIVYMVVLLAPTVIFDSSMWGQCDSIYASFCVFTIYFLMKDQDIAAFICYGFAFAFKLQSIFILPFIILLYVKNKKISLLDFIYIPLVMFVSSLGGILQGRPVSDVFLIYVNQTNTYANRLTLNYPSIYGLWTQNSNDNLIPNSSAGSVMAICGFGICFLYCLRKIKKLSATDMLTFAFLSTYFATLTMPNMHERYSYLFVVLSIVLAALNKKLILPCIGLLCIDMMTYGYYLTDDGYDLKLLTMFNIALFCYYAYFIFKNRTEPEEKPVEKQAEPAEPAEK